MSTLLPVAFVEIFLKIKKGFHRMLKKHGGPIALLPVLILTFPSPQSGIFIENMQNACIL